MSRIKIILFYNFKPNKALVAFKINGHGPDYVCAGISVLAINIINCIEKFTGDKFIYEYSKNGGMIDFRFLNQRKISHDAALLIKTLEVGLKDIAKSYKNFVELKEVSI